MKGGHMHDGPVDWPPLDMGHSPGPGQYVPWGKHIPRWPGMHYYVATGAQECSVCRKIVENGW
jgi:hypothetical protein